MRRTQNLAVEHTGQAYIVGKHRTARDFLEAIEPLLPAADHTKWSGSITLLCFQ